MENKTVFAAVCGRTNAGKSSLVNLLVGEKIAIVSDKPQTTRTRINGILTKDGVQYVFVDTPGFHKEKSALSKHMHKSIRSGVAGVDVVILVVDAAAAMKSKRPPKLPALLENMEEDIILILNKTDLIKDKTLLLKLIQDYSALRNFAEVIPVSAKSGDNTEDILGILQKYAKSTPGGGDGFYFDPGLPTDQPEKVWLTEIVREKLLNELREELPHGIAVQIEELEYAKTTKGKTIVNLSALIVCEKDSHKGMIIGKQGAVLKKIGEEARLDAEEYFGCKVNLKLWVKVAENWRNRESLINEFGLKAED